MANFPFLHSCVMRSFELACIGMDSLIIVERDMYLRPKMNK